MFFAVSESSEAELEERETEREREKDGERVGMNFFMASLFAITLCHNICNFCTVRGKFLARHNPLPAKPPPRHNFFQLLAPAGGLEIFLWRVTLVDTYICLRREKRRKSGAAKKEREREEVNPHGHVYLDRMR
jgi:hypothetical protein